MLGWIHCLQANGAVSALGRLDSDLHFLWFQTETNIGIPATLCEANNYLHHTHWETKLERVTSLRIQGRFNFSNSSSDFLHTFVSALKTILSFALKIRICKTKNNFLILTSGVLVLSVENVIAFLNLRGLVLLGVCLENWTTWTPLSYLNCIMEEVLVVFVFFFKLFYSFYFTTSLNWSSHPRSY